MPKNKPATPAGPVEISNWLVYALRGAHGYLAVNGQILVFTATTAAKAYRAARQELAEYRLRPLLLDDIKEFAAKRSMGVNVNPEETVHEKA